MIITKNEFCDIMKSLQEASELREKVNELFQNSRENIKNDFMNAASLQISHEDIVIDLLSKMFDNEYDIEYFVYELNYGKEYEPGMVMDDNECIDFSTAEWLYDYLTRELKNAL